MQPEHTKRLRRFTRAAAIGCWLLLAVYWIALRFVGESWVLSGALLYAPHVLWLLPTGGLLVALAIIGPRQLLPVQLGAIAFVLFELMGLVTSGPAPATPGAPRMRVLSVNVASGRKPLAPLVAELGALQPDLVVAQESTEEANRALAAALPGFHTLASTQFFVASRSPLRDLLEPSRLPAGGHERSPRFIRVTAQTPLGALDVLVVHPISPRDALEELRYERLGAERSEIVSNTELRRRQLAAIVEVARTSTNPVIIAGDTNLPTHSRIYAELLEGWKDGFSTVGRGFGYTFPVGRRFAWMRIDRILAKPPLRFLRFGVGDSRGSDHYLVWADLERSR